MADVPYSLASDNEKEFLDNTLKLMRDLTEQRIGNSPIADVFASPADVLTLQIKENSGLYKNDDDELDINVTASCISNTPSGGVESTNVQAAINELDGDKISGNGTGDCYVQQIKIQDVTAAQFSADYAYISPYDTTGAALIWNMLLGEPAAQCFVGANTKAGAGGWLK